MGSGERPIGTAKGKQSDAEALCHPPPPFPLYPPRGPSIRLSARRAASRWRGEDWAVM